MRRRTILLSGASILAGSALGCAISASRDAAGARTILAALKTAREADGLPGLRVDSRLVWMARLQTFRMLELGETTHIDAEDGDPTIRARQCGYLGCVLGETLAESEASAFETAALWLSHDATRAVLLDPEAREVGIFGLREHTDRVWWDLVVGRPTEPT